MHHYIDFIDRYKRTILVLATLIVALSSVWLKDLAFEGSYRIWFDKESSIVKEYDAFRSTFSGDDTFIVAFKDDEGIFTPKAVQTILDLTKEFEAIEGVQKVQSLSNYQYIQSDEEDIIVEDFLFDTHNLAQKEALAKNDNLILNSLISSDGKATILAVHLNTHTGSNEAGNMVIMKRLNAITKRYEERGYRFYITGSPAITASLVTISQSDASVLMPLAVFSIIVLLYLLFRTVIGVLIPSVVIVFSLLLTLNFQMMLGYKLNNFTVNIPAFITAIAIASSLHLLLAWVYYRHKKHTNKQALIFAMQSNIIPIAMTSLTTAIGFASLMLSAIEPISTLGIAISSGAVFVFVLVLVVVPAIILTLPKEYPIKKITLFNFLETKGYGAFIVRHDRKIVAIFGLLFVMMGAGMTQLKIDSNSIKYFEPKTQVRSGSEFVEEHITGAMSYEVIIDALRKEGAKNPAFLSAIITFETALKKRYPTITFSHSLKDIIVRMQQKLNHKDGLPNTQELSAQYLLLYSMSLPQGMELNDQIDTTERYLRLSLKSKIQDTSKDLEMIAWIENYWKNNTPYSANVQGQTTIFAYMQSSVTDTLIYSISLTLALVSLVMLFIFRRARYLWIFIVPNIAPIVLVAGVMGYLGITVDIGVAISAGVILGIAVDDTIHFFGKYFSLYQTKPFEEVCDYILSHSGNAMILTTFILSLTFSLFALSRFVPNISFATVTVIALNLALLMDLILLPALLSLIYHRKRR